MKLSKSSWRLPRVWAMASLRRRTRRRHVFVPRGMAMGSNLMCSQEQLPAPNHVVVRWTEYGIRRREFTSSSQMRVVLLRCVCVRGVDVRCRAGLTKENDIERTFRLTGFPTSQLGVCRTNGASDELLDLRGRVCA